MEIMIPSWIICHSKVHLKMIIYFYFRLFILLEQEFDVHFENVILPRLEPFSILIQDILRKKQNLDMVMVWCLW